MFILSIFQWWYTGGWRQRWHHVLNNASNLADGFSLGIIATTLFKPWKQLTALDANETFVRRAVDSLISRFVGFWIRSFVLIAGTLYITITTVINLAVAITWPVIPFLPLLFVFLGLSA